MTNITIALDEDAARWARSEAARRNTSVSELVGELLREHMQLEADYEASMRAYLSGGAKRLKAKGVYPTREELHARGDLR